MIAHKNIRIVFRLRGYLYEAVGFLKNDNEQISLEEARKRTKDKNGGAIGVQDAFSRSDLEGAPEELRQYFLLTAIPCPQYDRYFLQFFYSLFDKEKRWHVNSHFLLDRDVDFQRLIVRRVQDASSGK